MTRLPKVRIAPEVEEALSRGGPVVALESTVVTHGLPRPRNLELALRLEEVVRSEGAVPATVGLLGGEVRVGLSATDLERLAAGGADKASLWNLAALSAANADAGTTVATTLYAAHNAGVPVFATGGIGGVHDAPFDESADLPALASFSVLTVCAGPKSILNAAATVERLETLGVALLGYRSDTLAGFLVPRTPIALPSRIDSPEEAAAVLKTQRELGLTAGVLISNPVSNGMTESEFGALLTRAAEAAEEAGVSGRETTPYMLGALAELSNGATVDVNLRLLEENSRLASRIAAAFSRVDGRDRGTK